MTAVQQSVASTTRTTWQLDAAHTLVEFAVKHMMIATVKGRFTDVQGTVTTLGDDPATATIDITIAAASISTGQEQRDAHLRSADFLEVERYPHIRYVSRRVERAGDDTLRVAGELTVRGITRPVALDVTIEGRGNDPWGNERAGFSARARIDRRDFGLTWNQALETGGVLVGNDVRIAIETELVKQP